MNNPRFPLRWIIPIWLAVLAPGGIVSGQIAAPPTGVEREYKTEGTAGQPFTVEVLDAHRTVGNTLLLRLAITNRGSGPLAIQYDFADAQTPAENGKISGVYAVDPNGQVKYEILRNAEGRTLCSRLEPELAPGERRNVFAQLAPPPETSSAVSIVFPLAPRIENVPIGLPGSGEAQPASSSIGDPGPAPAPAAAMPPSVAPTGPNNAPDVHPNEIATIPPGSVRRAAGSIESSNSIVPFTVEAIDLKRGTDGLLKLRLALTNNGGGQLDAAGQFTSGLADPANSRKISGVYLVDPVTHARYEVARPSETAVLCSEIAPELGAGERRELEAEFAQVPASVTSAYVYFPHAAPISGVPVTP